jgi:uridine phosphorylase
MLSAVIAGQIITDPKSGISKNRTEWANALVRVAVGQNQETGVRESTLVQVGAFGEEAAKLAKGDAVSAAGALKPTVYTKDGQERHGLSLTATGILTAYKERQRRPEAKAQEGDGRSVKAFYEASKSRYAPEPDDYNDAVSF